MQLDRPKDLKKISNIETRYPSSSRDRHWNIRFKIGQKRDDQLQKNRYPFSAWDRHLFIKSPIGHIKRAKNDHLHQN